MSDDLALATTGHGQQGELPVFQGTAWEDHVQAWIDAETVVTDVRWMQAAICASVVTQYGDQSVEKFAASVGVHPRRVYEYRAVYTLAQEFGIRSPNLQFSHYVVASSADQPLEVLEAAAENSLSVRDVKRLIADKQAPPVTTSLPAIADNPAVVEAWHRYQEAGRELIRVAAVTAPAILYALEEIQYALEIPEQTVADRIVYAIETQGLTELDTIAQALGQDRERVRVWLARMVEAGTLSVRRQELDERVPGARGPARVYYSVTSGGGHDV
jgi:DNA-binding PadR family transcriptional regulator